MDICTAVDIPLVSVCVRNKSDMRGGVAVCWQGLENASWEKTVYPDLDKK